MLRIDGDFRSTTESALRVVERDDHHYGFVSPRMMVICRFGCWPAMRCQIRAVNSVVMRRPQSVVHTHLMRRGSSVKAVRPTTSATQRCSCQLLTRCALAHIPTPGSRYASGSGTHIPCAGWNTTYASTSELSFGWAVWKDNSPSSEWDLFCSAIHSSASSSDRNVS